MIRRARATAAVFTAIVVTVGAARPSSATLVTETYDFSLTGFVSAGGPPTPPVATLIGSVTMTFDPTVAQTNQTSGITLDSLNIALGSPVAFDVFPNDPATGKAGIVVGGLAFGANGISFAAAGDFAVPFTIDEANPADVLSTAPGGYGLNFGIYDSSNVKVTAVPEPAALSLFVVGLIGIWSRRRSRREQQEGWA